MSAGGIPQITEQTDANIINQLFNSKFVPVGEEKEKQELQDENYYLGFPHLIVLVRLVTKLLLQIKKILGTEKGFQLT